jgi:LPS export ABC transporter protein LptC
MIVRIITLVSLLAAIAVVVLFVPKTTEVPEESVAEANSDFYLKGFTLSGYKASGEQTHRLQGALLERKSDSQMLVIRSPQIDLKDSNQGVWQLTASTGEFNQAMDNAKLSGGVVLSREENPLAKMQTPELDIDLESKIITSVSGVIISQGNSQIESAAMTADLSQDTLKLSERVRGVYVP